MSTLLTRRFGLLMLAQAFFAYALSSFMLLPKFLTQQLGASPSDIGWVMAAYGAVTLVLVPTMGAVVDRRGRRTFLTLGGLVMAGSSAAFVLVESVGPLIFVLRGIQGAGFAMAFVAGATLAVDEAPPERLGQSLALFGTTFLSMNAVGPAAVEAISNHWSWDVAFLQAGAASLLSSLLSLFVREGRPEPDDELELDGLLRVARRPGILRVSLVVVLTGAAFGTMMIFHQPFALELGTTDLRWFFIGFASTGLVIRLALGDVVDRLGRRRVTLGALGVYVLAVSSMVWLRAGSLSLALHGTAFGLAHAFFYPALSALMIEGASPHERGKVVALLNGAFNSGIAVAAPVLGLTAEHLGYPVLFGVAAACPAVALAVLAVSPEGRPEPMPLEKVAIPTLGD